MLESKTFMLYKGDGSAEEDQLGVVTVTANKLKLGIVSQFMDLRDGKDKCFGTLTWPSWVRIREVGK